MTAFLSVSLTAGMLTAVILLLRALLLGSLPKRCFVLLWAVVVLRLLLPVSLPNPFGVKTPMSVPAMLQPYAQNRLSSGDLSTETTSYEQSTVGISTSDSTKEAPSAVASQLDRKDLLRILWICGVLGTLGWFIFISRRTREVVQEAIPLTPDEQAQVFAYTKQVMSEGQSLRCYGFNSDGSPQVRLLISDRLNTPVTIGLLRQKIVLSKMMARKEPRQLEYVLLHEMVHVRRHDNLLKLVAILAVALHWFNPLSWVMLHFLSRDIELSCDEKVLNLTGQPHRTGYADSMLLLAEQSNRTALLYSGFGKNDMKERIVMIMKHRKIRQIAYALAGLLLVLSFSVFV